MIINKLLDKLVDKSLPFSQMVVDIPTDTFSIKIDMLEESTYEWLENSTEIVSNISCGDIIGGVAHDVVIILKTNDGSVKLIDAK